MRPCLEGQVEAPPRIEQRPGCGLDLQAALPLVQATAGLRGLPLRLSLASAYFVGRHLFGGWLKNNH